MSTTSTSRWYKKLHATTRIDHGFTIDGIPALHVLTIQSLPGIETHHCTNNRAIGCKLPRAVPAILGVRRVLNQSVFQSSTNNGALSLDTCDAFLWCLPENVDIVRDFRDCGLVRHSVVVVRTPHARPIKSIVNNTPTIGQSSPRNPVVCEV